MKPYYPDGRWELCDSNFSDNTSSCTDLCLDYGIGNTVSGEQDNNVLSGPLALVLLMMSYFNSVIKPLQKKAV